jgi:hypothetical protein
LVLAGPYWVRKFKSGFGSRLISADFLRIFYMFDGGRTRARTLDPLIKRNRVMYGGMEARAALPDVTAQGGEVAKTVKSGIETDMAFYREYLIDDRSLGDDRRRTLVERHLKHAGFVISEAAIARWQRYAARVSISAKCGDRRRPPVCGAPR